MTTLDLAAIRADTPTTATLNHLNSAGSSLPTTAVLDATIDYLRLEAEIGGYAAADHDLDELNRFYRAGARLLNCDESELAFGSSASEGWWRAFTAVRLEAGDTILTGRSEFVANGIGLSQAAARGVSVVIIDDDEHGQIDVAAFANRLDDTVKLVCLTHVPMTSGLVNPAEEIGRLAKEAGAYYLLDACQSVGQMRVDVQAIQCDFLSFTGRKWVRGPRGTGALYVRGSILDDLLPPTFIDGRSADWTGPLEYQLQPSALRYEFGEIGFAAKRGLGVAMEYALDLGLDAIDSRIALLANRLRAELPQIAGVSVYDQGHRKCGIVTLTVEGHDALAIVHELRRQGINTAAPPARAAMLDIGARGIDAVVRVSPHYFNTDAELDGFLDALAQITSSTA